MRDLPLRARHEACGALCRLEAGWDVPASYGPVHVEVAAVRSGAGMVDLSDRAKIRVTGSERVDFLDGLVTADVKSLTPGMSAYALVLTEKSRVVGDLRVFSFKDQLTLDVEAIQKDTLLAYVNRLLVSDDATLEDLGACGHLEVHGPASPGVLSGALGTDLRDLQEDAFSTPVLERRHEVVVARTRRMGEAGFSVWGVGMDLEILWSRLFRRGVAPLGRDALEVLRIEAGQPRVGVDMGEDTLALEVAPEGAISFTKGCYVGQEVVARGTYRGHVNRRLMGLQIDGDVPPVRGDPVRREEREVGRVTSGAWSPTLRRVIALALMRVEEVTPRMDLFVDRGGWDLRARLHSLPFVRPAG